MTDTAENRTDTAAEVTEAATETETALPDTQAPEAADEAAPAVSKRSFKEIVDIGLGFFRDWGWVGLLFLAVVIIGYYTLFPSRGYFHSDTTDTLMWAIASHESGSLFNTDFSYACLLPFGTSLIMLALIPVFGITMKTHVIGMFCFFAMFTAALIWMLRKMKWKWGWISVAVYIELMICSGSEKLREIFWGHTIYYSLGVLFIFVGLSLLFTLMDLQNKMAQAVEGAPHKKTLRGIIICLVLIGVWFLLTCTNQIIAITIFALPVMGAVFIERWLDEGTQPLAPKNRRALVTFAVMGAGMVLGYLLTNALAKDIVAGYEGAYSNYSNMDNWKDNFLNFPKAWITLLGVDVRDGDKLMSVDSVKALLLIITSVLMLVIPVIALCCYKKIEDPKLRILILTYWLMTMLIMMGFVLGKLSNANWRLSPIVAMSTIVSIAFVRWASGQISMQRVMTLFMIPILFVSTVTAITIMKMPSDNTENNHLYRLAEALEDRNLSYGYATFWNANGLTIVSDSKVKCRSVNIADTGYSPYYYQGCRSWYDDQIGQPQYFLLMSGYERDLLVNGESPLVGRAVQEFVVDGYTVWVFNENIF